MNIAVKTTVKSIGNIEDSELEKIVDELSEVVKNIKSNEILDDITYTTFINMLKNFYSGCLTFGNFITQVLLKDQTGKIKGSSFQHISVSNESTKNLMSQIIILGTNIVFSLRQFITNETLEFVMGGTIDGKELVQVKKSQEELFADYNNLRVSFSNGQIELSRAIENLANYTEFEENKGLAQQWGNILEWGFISNYRTQANEISSGINKSGAITHIYRKNKPDTNVYLRFKTVGGHTDMRTAQHYYGNGDATSVKGMLAYDRGWLFQWIKMYEAQDYEIVDQIIQGFKAYPNTPLKVLMTLDRSIVKRETDPGIKGGDFNSEQYKYTNRRVITLFNIYQILYGGGKNYHGIIKALEKVLFSENASSQQTGINNLTADFINSNRQNFREATQQRLESILKLTT